MSDRNDTSTWREFELYLHHDDPIKRKRAAIWSTAIGLQQVDGLRVSNYLLSVALRNIEGEIDTAEAQRLINAYYDQKKHAD